MKTIDLKNQPVLGFWRVLEICINGIRYRLFRSVVTMAVIAIAIAFMMNVLCEAVSTRAIALTAGQKTAEHRLTMRWASRLSAAGAPETILRQAAAEAPNSSLGQELRNLGGLSGPEMAAYAAAAQHAAAYLEFFDSIGYGQRRVLAGSASGTAIFDRLQNPQQQAQFEKSLRQMKSVRLPASPEEFRQFLRTWPETRKTTLGIQSGWTAAVARLSTVLQGKPLDQVFINSEKSCGQIIRTAGFCSFDQQTEAAIADQARQLQDMERLENTIERPEIRALISAYLNILPGDITMPTIWKLLLNRRAADWYLDAVKGATKIDLGGITPDRIAKLARLKAETAALDDALQQTGETEGGFMGIGTRMSWLVLVSLLVCAAGISNAMLMTVTERFREIATLKCLGALDGFIMVLFLIEACVLGLVGGMIGGLLGSLIGFSRMLGAFGALLIAAFPVTQWLIAMGMAVISGIVLAALASVYPASIAARLAPMEAMRIE
ncbi:MAG: hypothetical protein PHW60_15990 [Kiritimatiellae bacterium]|nr:hypothetical protein [Kiritimatiellia bacterium]